MFVQKILRIAATAFALAESELAAAELFRLFPEPVAAVQFTLAGDSRSRLFRPNTFGFLDTDEASLSGIPIRWDPEPRETTIYLNPQRAPAPQTFWAGVISLAAMTGSALNSFDDGPNEKFHLTSERWFQSDTYVGGGDKASHFVSYNIVSKELAIIYQGLGYSPKQSRLMGFAVSTFTGLVTELGDGRGQYGFSYEDFLSDAAGAASGALIAAYDLDDLIGFRAGVMRAPSTPKQDSVDGLGKDYSREIYTADLKLVGLARRARIDPGLARYLLFSTTYGVKGYPYALPEFRQRQIGFEIGLNLGQVVWDLGVGNDSWWGIALHFVFDNIRLPYTAIGYRYDLNHGQWHGPDSGNGFSFSTP